MMTASTKAIAKQLKEIIDKNGPSYMTDEPYQVYKELVRSKATDRKTAGALLHALVNGVQAEAEKSSDLPGLSLMIKRGCSLNKAMADRIAEIFFILYSPDNKADWEKKNQEGLSQFLNEEFSFNWKGFSEWDAGNGTVGCYYEAGIVLMPTKEVAEDVELKQLLDRNPFLRKEDIETFWRKDLKEFLDEEFEEYCTEDDYYQPVVEDFEIDYCVAEWSKKNGFEVVSCEGNGDDSGYEPKSHWGWY